MAGFGEAVSAPELPRPAAPEVGPTPVSIGTCYKAGCDHNVHGHMRAYLPAWNPKEKVPEGSVGGHAGGGHHLTGALLRLEQLPENGATTMTSRILTLIAAVVATPVSAQDLPDNPADFAALVAAGSVPAAKLFDRGCPSESEWSGKVLDRLKTLAETDLGVRTSLARAVRNRIGDCPQADGKWAQEWLAEAVEAVYLANRDGCGGLCPPVVRMSDQPPVAPVSHIEAR